MKLSDTHGLDDYPTAYFVPHIQHHLDESDFEKQIGLALAGAYMDGILAQDKDSAIYDSTQPAQELMNKLKEILS